jgi:hypothetical protein
MTRKRTAKAIAEYENAIIVEEISAAVADGSRVNHTRIAALLPHLPKTTIGPRIQRLRKRVKYSQSGGLDAVSAQASSDIQDAESAQLLLSVLNDHRSPICQSPVETELAAALKHIQRLKDRQRQDVLECDQLRLELSDAICQIRIHEERLDHEERELVGATSQVRSLVEHIDHITAIHRDEVNDLRRRLYDKQSIISRLLVAIQHV